MHQIPVTSPILKDLFDPQLPNSPALWSVLKGNHTGKALVDEPQQPSQAVLRTDAVLTYYSIRTQQSFLNQAIAILRELGFQKTNSYQIFEYEPIGSQHEN